MVLHIMVKIEKEGKGIDVVEESKRDKFTIR